MGALVKLGLVALVGFIGFSVWQYGFSGENEGPVAAGGPIALTEQDRVKGDANAPVTLVEYTDFQCPACGAYYPILDQLSKDLEGKMKFVVRHYPLIQIHKNALPSARAAEAAGRQGKFWEMYDVLFANQKEWSNADDPTKSIFPAYATRVGIDVEKFKQDMTDSSLDEKINQDRATGNELKISGTPSFFLNGKKLENPSSVDAFKKAIENAVTE